MKLLTFLLVILLSLGSALCRDWNILSYITGNQQALQRQRINVNNYCNSWMLNKELNNVRNFNDVPAECVSTVSTYMTSVQYTSDISRATEEAALYLTESFTLRGDGKDAWIFDVDDTLLSNAPFYKKYNYGGVDGDGSYLLEKWMREENADAIDSIYDLYHDIKRRGIKIFIITSRKENLRDVTTDNLISTGYGGWSELIMRCEDDRHSSIKEFKKDQRKRLVEQGYRIWGVISDQWSSILGHPQPMRTFKIPNPMYYVS